MVAKKRGVSWWKAKVWKLFSQYIRRKYADFEGNVTCVTCGVVKPWKEMQAGHFVDGHGNAIMFDEQLVHPQCFKCNFKSFGCLAGNKVKYTLFMMKKYALSPEQIEEIENRKHQVRIFKIPELQTIYEHYEDALVGLDVRDSR